MKISKRKWLVMPAVAILVAGMGIFFAGCSSSDDKNACEELCRKICDMGVQCGALPSSRCSDVVIQQCADAANTQGGNEACKDGLDQPLNCSMF